MLKPLIEMDNYGRSTHVSIFGIDIGRVMESFSFDQIDKERPMMSMTIDIQFFVNAVSSLSDDDLAKIRETVMPWIERKRTDASLFEKEQASELQRLSELL